MTKRRAALAGGSGEAELGAIENPLVNAMRFTLMRLVRLVLTLVCEVATIALCVPVGMSAFLTAAWGACVILFVLLAPIAAGYAWMDGTPMPGWTTWYHEMMGTLLDESTAGAVSRFLVLNPYIILAASSAALMFCWGQALAFGVPYRYENTPPGMLVVSCGACQNETPNDAQCTHCKASRLAEYAALKLLWLVNVGISSIWGMHDLFAGFVGFARGK